MGPAPSSPNDSSIPDPFDDADALGELEHEIATLAAHISAATYRLLTLIAEFDRRRGWELGGHRTCAHWLHAATGIDLGAAREKVRTARALAELPQTSETMARGELSFSAVRALTRVATPECEEELLDVAKSSTTAQLERFVRAWRKLSRADEAKLERERWRSRRLSIFPDDEGMYVVKGRLPAEVGAVLMRAVEAAGDALYRTEGGQPESGRKESQRESPKGSPGGETTPKQRRADALGLVAERALSAGFGLSDSVPVSGSRAERYQVMLQVDGTTLRKGNGTEGDAAGSPSAMDFLGFVGARGAGDGGPAWHLRWTAPGHGEPGCSHLEDGTRVSAETSRRLSCDAGIVKVVREAEGDVLDVGRRTRTVPPALRRALEVRDRGCRFPGCGLRFTDAHHVEHWADGGETKLENLILLCRFHHRLVHEEGWRVEFWGKERRPAFIDPQGRIRMDVELESGREVELPDRPVRALVRENEMRGVEVDGWSLRPSATATAGGGNGGAGRLGPSWPAEARALEALDAAHFGT